MPPPQAPPIGLHLASVARTVNRSFDAALAAAGGSLPTWLILLNLRIGKGANQRGLASAVGIREATLTHHLNALVEQGLVARSRDPRNRRVQSVELTDDGDRLFEELRQAATRFDTRLRRGLSSADLEALRGLLDRLRDNVSDG